MSKKKHPRGHSANRLRFTVAHELVHSLAFRHNEFGVQLRHAPQDDSSRKALVEAIERETDRLGPLLLLSEKALEALFPSSREPVNAHELARFRRRMGVSREVLINRLRQLASGDANRIRASGGLQNTGLLVGEWIDSSRAVLRGWPLFANFDRNLVPAFFIRLASENQLPAHTILDNERFAPCGGDLEQAVCSVFAGVPNHPDAERMMIRCAVEPSRRQKGRRFIVVVQKHAQNA